MNENKFEIIDGLRLQSHYLENAIIEDSKILRIVKKEYFIWAYELMNSGLIKELVDKNLFPKTKIHYINKEKKEITIESERIPIRNNFYTWSFDMIKKSAKITLKVNNLANKYGYELRDGHILNCMFHFGKCLFIDFDSFVKINNIKKWIASREFIEHQVKLLQVLSLQSNYEYQKSIKGMIGYIPDKIYKAVISYEDQLNRNEIINEVVLLEKISSITLNQTSTMWSSYHENKDIINSYRIDNIIRLIKNYQPKNIIDLASNSGSIAKEILKNNNKVEYIVCIDKDHIAINELFLSLKDEKILPIVSDIVYDFYLPCPYSKLIDNIKGELVICLALTHHLILTSNLEIDSIFKIIKKYSSKYVAIEFMPLGLYAGDIEKTPPTPDWYSEEWFENSFLKHFKLIKKEQTEINRIMFFGEII